ncbi:MAG: hypothetical protein QW232_04300, partial [Saccharolobus sp.]
QTLLWASPIIRTILDNSLKIKNLIAKPQQLFRNDTPINMNKNNACKHFLKHQGENSPISILL